MDVAMLDTNLLGNIVKKILQSFEEWNLKTSRGKMKYSHIDVTLLKKDTMYYATQVTNYGQSVEDVLSYSKKIFQKFLTTHIILENSLVSTVYTRNQHSDCHEILDLRLMRNRLSLVKNINDNNLINLFYQKKYLSFLLKHKFIFSDIETLMGTILNEIILLQQLNPNTKFTVHINEKMLYNNYIPLDNDYKTCQVLVIALTNIIKHSIDIRFKENCFSMLNVDNSHEVETALMTKLLPLIHDNYTFSNGN
ncbi:hypothetical protein ANTQUA_LOCUS8716 [Anthophora quadrimaculata]